LILGADKLSTDLKRGSILLQFQTKKWGL